MKKFQIWREGYMCQGMDRPARAEFLGEEIAHNFKEACIKYYEKNPDMKKHFDPERMTEWGCGLYDNSYDARKYFG
jgi:hypothetical protein